MKFVLLSDVHLLWQTPVGRLDNTAEIGLRKLKYVLEWAQSHNAVVLQAGDFFDRPRSWYLLSEVISLLRKYDALIYCVYGQHDQYMYSRETRHATSLGILEKMGLVTILGSEPILFQRGAVQVYGAGFGDEVPEVKFEKGKTKILVIHASISDKPLWPGHEYTDADKFLEEYKVFDLILCGDIHRKFIGIGKNGGTICNTGPMIRKTVDLWDHCPGFFISDMEGDVIDRCEIPHEPPEKALTREHIDSKEETERMLDEFISAVSSDEVQIGASFEENLLAFIKENDIEQEVVDIISTVMGEKEG